MTLVAFEAVPGRAHGVIYDLGFGYPVSYARRRA